MIVNSSLFGVTTSMATTLPPFARLMSRTPPDVREADRSSFTWKRIACPFEVTSTTEVGFYAVDMAGNIENGYKAGGKGVGGNRFNRVTITVD